MSNIKIALIIYLVGCLITFIGVLRSYYVDWKNGCDIRWSDILVWIVMSILSWFIVVVAVAQRFEDISDKVIIRGKNK